MGGVVTAINFHILQSKPACRLQHLESDCMMRKQPALLFVPTTFQMSTIPLHDGTGEVGSEGRRGEPLREGVDGKCCQ